MIDIVVCVFGIIGIFLCEIIENVMWECDYEKALGCEFEHYYGAKIGEGEQE